ncbi:PLDc_N domain-containing protein [Rhodococcus sp. ABRD24]|uniref:PLD nuclease N-terminal domain-containing protein n=1 Tax=Rhodococcus sp. ABRD24 TaxID=2507582 RepID=UPI00103AF3E9|nr:PLD nuclease N-terminal domain-containing protein [Rhodococcus sp. ABRD24]QBJ94987.1 PLDc_N domain-containing protein [Rhodococcus sp. ABRD24]
MDEHDPTLPLAFDIAWMALVLLWLILVVSTSISVLRARHITTPAKIAWILLVLALPVLGSLLWLLIGNKPGTDDVASGHRPH